MGDPCLKTKEPDSICDKYNMRCYWMLMLSFLAGAMLSAQAQAQSVSASMQVSMNVIQDCSVSVTYNEDREGHEQQNIRCGGDSPHRVYYHRRNEHEETQDAYARSKPRRSDDAHQRRERDNDEVVWLTAEF